MSTILRALKKLEEDTDAESSVPADTIVRSARRREFKPVVVRGLIVTMAIALIVAGGFILGRKSPVSSPETGTVVSHTTPIKAPAPARRESHDIRVKKTKKLTGTGAPQMNAQTKRYPSTGPAGLGAAQNRPAPGRMNVPASEPAAAPPDATEPMAIPPEPRTPPARPAPDNTPPVSRVKELNESAGLTLQAISWSSDETKRIAVINGQICREGDRVLGYAVLQINPDDVIVSNGAVSGKLSFK